MQIQLPADKARLFQTRYFNCISDQGDRDYRLATLFHDVNKTVTKDGFDSFAQNYFKLNAEQLSKAHEMVTVRNIISRRRVWLRLGGYRLVKLVADVTDEDRRTAILNKILAPVGIVNYCEKDLQMLIKGEDLCDSEIVLTDSYTRTRSEGRKEGNKGRRNQKTRNRRRKTALA